LIDEVLAGDLIVDERADRFDRADELDGLGGVFFRAEAVEDREIESVNFGDTGKLRHNSLPLRREKEVEALGGALVNGAGGFVEWRRIPKSELQDEPVVEKGKGRRSVVHEMKLPGAFLHEGIELRLILGLQAFYVRVGGSRDGTRGGRRRVGCDRRGRGSSSAGFLMHGG